MHDSFAPHAEHHFSTMCMRAEPCSWQRPSAHLGSTAHAPSWPRHRDAALAHRVVGVEACGRAGERVRAGRAGGVEAPYHVHCHVLKPALAVRLFRREVQGGRYGACHDCSVPQVYPHTLEYSICV